MTNRPEEPSPESLAAFRDFLRRREREPEASFDEFARLRPEIAQELDRLRDQWDRATQLFERLGTAPTLAERLRITYGKSIDLDISLAGEESASDPASSTRIVRRLAKGAGKHYARKGLVARGGMGAILRVWDEDLRRTLAMKVVLGRDEDPGDEGPPKVGEHQLVRFLEEAQITGQLHHPGILPVHDLGIDATGRVYFTMPLVQGETLREIFDHVKQGEGGWGTTRAINVLVKVCEAMAFAHSKGVIHRDLKPANIMVGRFGETYVMDWGLARVLGRKERRVRRRATDGDSWLSAVHTDRRDAAESAPDTALVTLDGDVVGTPAYMSPEQARGAQEDLGPRSDVYSVGAMLYQLLTGRAPYHQPDVKVSTHTVLARVLDGPPTRIREIRRDVPEELVAICNKAMAREHRERYVGMLELAEDLRAFVEGHVVRAYETGALAEFRKWVARNRIAAASIATSIVLAIAGLSTVIVQQSRSRAELEEQFAAVEEERDRAEANEQEATRERDRAEANELEASRLRAEAQALADRARRQSYLGNVRAADGGLKLHRTREAKEMLAACEEELRGWEWRYLARKCDGEEQRLDAPDFESATLVDGGGAVLVCAGNKIRRWDPERGEIVSSLSSPKAQNRPVFAVASASLARVFSLHVGGRLAVWDARTGDLVADNYAHRPFAVFAMAQSADGRLFATCGQDLTVPVWDAAQAEVLATFPNDELALSIAFSPDGSSLAVGYRDGSILLWTLPAADEPVHDPARKPALELSGHTDGVTSLAWSPDGALVLSGSSDGRARVWSAETGETVMVLGGHGQAVLAVAFHPDGQRVATGSADDTIRLWDAASGRQADVLLGHTGAVRFLAFHSDGGRLFSGSADGTLRVWNLERDPLFLKIRDAHTNDIDALAFAPDGIALATGSADGDAKLWNARTGGPLLTLAGHGQGVTAVAFDPSGKRLVTGSVDQTVRVFDAEEGGQLRILRGHTKRVLCVATGGAGGLVASGGGDRQIRMWELETGISRSVLQGHQGSVNSVAFTENGERLASASSDGTLRVWTLANGQYLVLEGHEKDVLCTAFSPDGRQVASGSKDGTVRVWDAETGESVHVLDGHDADVVSVAFGAGEGRLLSASADGSFRVWDLTLGAQLLAVEQGVPLRAIAAFENRVAVAGSDYGESETHGDVWIFEPRAAP